MPQPADGLAGKLLCLGDLLIRQTQQVVVVQNHQAAGICDGPQDVPGGLADPADLQG